MHLSRSRSLALLVAGSLFLTAVPARAQQARLSPPDVTGAVVDGSRVTVYYSRPYTRDPKTGQPRKIWGGLVPLDRVWRLGANEATLLVTQQPLEMGGATIPAGASSLFLLPRADGARLIVNRQVGHWGSQYDEKQDIARIELKAEPLEKPVDQFTISVTRNREAPGGTLKLMWENVQYSVPFAIKK